MALHNDDVSRLNKSMAEYYLGNEPPPQIAGPEIRELWRELLSMWELRCDDNCCGRPVKHTPYCREVKAMLDRYEERFPGLCESEEDENAGCMCKRKWLGTNIAHGWEECCRGRA